MPSLITGVIRIAVDHSVVFRTKRISVDSVRINIGPVENVLFGVVGDSNRVGREAERQKLASSAASCVNLINVSQL